MRQIPKAIIAQAQLAHEAIHSPQQTHVKIGGQILPVIKHTNGCRAVALPNYVVIEQNKNTPYGKTHKGRLSWVIPKDPSIAWYMIEDTKE